MSSPRTVRVYQTPVIAARALAERIVTVSEQAMAVRGRFVIALAGGSTPQMAYDILSAEFGERVDWESTYVFWGDERAVPPESSQSNVRMARDHMLNFVPVPTAHVYRIRGEMPPEAAAREYEHTLRAFFGGRTESEMPRFDVLLLGMGADGHTASLFPGHAALRERERLVLAVHEPRVQPPDRITLTLPALNSAAHIYFLVTGAEKAPAVRRVIQPAEGEAPLPAALVQPAHGDVTWILDAAAAHDLQPPDATATGTWPRPLPDPPASSGG